MKSFTNRVGRQQLLIHSPSTPTLGLGVGVGLLVGVWVGVTLVGVTVGVGVLVATGVLVGLTAGEPVDVGVTGGVPVDDGEGPIVNGLGLGAGVPPPRPPNSRGHDTVSEGTQQSQH